MPSTVVLAKRHPESVDRTTFGTSERQFSNLPKNTPAPNKYRPVHFTEASHAYSISRPPEIDINESKINKQKMLPGPGSYNNMKELKDNMYLAKSMLGGSLDYKPLENNGNPGPDAYQQNPIHSIPGFKIMPEIGAKRVEEDKNKEPLGP